MADSVMLEKAKTFAVDIVKLCRELRLREREYVLTNQLLRSGTSIGANIHESKYGQSPADFVAKMQIALKECYETEYWLELLSRSDYISEDTYKALRQEAGSVRRMLIASINTTKERL